MRVEGIKSVLPSFSAAKVSEIKQVKNEASKDASTKDASTKGGLTEEKAAVLYEPSSRLPSKAIKTTYKPDNKEIDKLISETEKRMDQLRNLVEQMILKQGNKINSANNMYALLREGKLEVDPQTAAQAQMDIGKDGYWGVENTSERMFSFAKALTGGNPDKALQMKNAFIQGFEAAGKAWGGNLPGICHETYDATIKKFDEWINQGEV